LNQSPDFDSNFSTKFYQRSYDELQLTPFGREKQNVKQLILEAKLWPTTLKNMFYSCGLSTGWPV
jgi:hypothetical protein